MNLPVVLKDKNTLKAIDTIVETTTPAEKKALLGLLDKLIAIRNKDMSRIDKIKETRTVFEDSKAALPLLKNIKGLLWDNRSLAWKIGVGLMAVVAISNPVNVGLAGFGGAVAVPLWIVVGGGYNFAVLLAEKLRRSLGTPKPGEVLEADYTVMRD